MKVTRTRSPSVARSVGPGTWPLNVQAGKKIPGAISISRSTATRLVLAQQRAVGARRLAIEPRALGRRQVGEVPAAQERVGSNDRSRPGRPGPSCGRRAASRRRLTGWPDCPGAEASRRRREAERGRAGGGAEAGELQERAALTCLAFEYTSIQILSNQNTELCYKKSSAVVLLHRRKLPEGHFPGADRTCRGRATWCRWDSSPPPSGVVPGTATTMVKTLAESGLVKYEPYAGVRLTASGEKLAALVVRRHRLIELFLVKVMGMSWTEVHEEAEHLEHAVSDRLIERIDEMLGRPAVDPHGDPIPDPDGVLERRPLDSLLSCPLREPVTISRVTDQDPEFLRFIERRDLKPGDGRRRSRSATPRPTACGCAARPIAPITIGARAASKVLVQAASAVPRSCGSPASAAAQTPAPPAPAPVEPFQITDNSFLVEEAFNQEPRIFQNIFGFTPPGRRLAADVHAGVAGAGHAPPALLHPRRGSRAGRTTASATSPELPLPGARGRAGTSGVLAARQRRSCRRAITWPAAVDGGLQINLPFSKQRGDFYLSLERRASPGCRAASGDDLLSRRSSPAARSTALRPMLQPDARVGRWASTRIDTPRGDDERTRGSSTLSPGVRGGWNLADDTQLILGAAVPITRTERRDVGRRLRLLVLRAAVQEVSRSVTCARNRWRPTSAFPRRGRPGC